MQRRTSYAIVVGRVEALLVVVVLMGLLGMAGPAQAVGSCSHYLAVDGDDAQAGSEEQPWRTAEHAADTARAGDVVCFAAGAYRPEDGELRFSHSGSEEQPITFTSWDGEVTIDGALTVVQGVSHLRLNGLRITGFAVWGVTLEGDNEDIVLSELDVGGGEAAIRFTVGDSGEDPQFGPVERVTVVDSVFHDSVFTAVDCTPGPCNDMMFQRLEIHGAGMGGDASFGADALAVERGRNLLVEDCYLHHNSGDGIDLNSRDAMRGDDVGTVVVRRNRVEQSLTNGIKLWRGGEVSGNLVWNSGESLLVLEQGSSYRIANNTLATADSHTYLAMVGYDPMPGSTTVELFNNIFFNDSPAMTGTLLFVSDTVQLEAGHNLFFNPHREEDVVCLGDTLCFDSLQIAAGQLAAAAGSGEDSLYGDPLFVDAANGDFRLAATSPARDAANGAYAPEYDLAGTSRLDDEAPDIGAFEASD